MLNTWVDHLSTWTLAANTVIIESSLSTMLMAKM